MTAVEQNALQSQAGRISETISRASQQAVDSVEDLNRRVQRGMRDINKKIKKVDETTVPDAFHRVPKYVSPRVHSWLDFAVSTYFIGLGVWFAFRRRGRAATAAFVNGAMVAGVSLLTDYDGDGRRPIGFKMHGTLDAVQATMAVLGPLMHGFANKPEAKYFWGQAANEVAVIATTDWDAGMSASDRVEFYR